ncbi:unnamed protein product [Nesidiocoris tenuis]|uniref:Uncharacterized protein n=1 Tax=Nesidiocoris tenuis TaxID=355587 RepID=A0A6H5GNM2_9HEMI|nr:unnamed protein product [Nesidiocoris tenuis]
MLVSLHAIDSKLVVKPVKTMATTTQARGEYHRRSSQASTSSHLKILNHPSYVYCCTWIGPSLAVTGCYDRALRLWDLSTVPSLVPKSGSTVSVGSLLDWTRCDPLQCATGHKARVNTLAVLSSDETLVSGDSDGVLIFWKLSTTVPRDPSDSQDMAIKWLDDRSEKIESGSSVSDLSLRSSRESITAPASNTRKKKKGILRALLQTGTRNKSKKGISNGAYTDTESAEGASRGRKSLACRQFLEDLEAQGPWLRPSTQKCLQTGSGMDLPSSNGLRIP